MLMLSLETQFVEGWFKESKQSLKGMERVGGFLKPGLHCIHLLSSTMNV